MNLMFNVQTFSQTIDITSTCIAKKLNRLQNVNFLKCVKIFKKSYCRFNKDR